MAHELKICSNGQVTLPRTVLDHLGVKQGEKIEASLLPDGRVELKNALPQHDLKSARGMLRRRRRAGPLAAIQDAIETRGCVRSGLTILDLLAQPGIEDAEFEPPRLGDGIF